MNVQTPEERILGTARTASGPSLDELSHRSPLLLVFLRHFG
ncbi:MAG: hypothetical protein ACOY3Y_00305 [Acidobacteriota bacterium]